MIETAKVVQVKKLTDSIYFLIVVSPKIADIIKPGQFCNIKVSNNYFPLLRRPFSISDVFDDKICFMFDIHGEGTKILSEKKAGDSLDILGPLGNGFTINEDIDKYILVAGGLGVAPFPFLIKKLSKHNYEFFLGAKNKNFIIDYGISNINIATDDGSLGLKGTVIDLLKIKIKKNDDVKIKILGCGPTPMLRELKHFVNENNYDCDVSTESAMACGFGICQGCPIPKKNYEGNYLLVCKDGPVFNINEIEL